MTCRIDRFTNGSMLLESSAMTRVLMWVPLPPPFAGPEVASQLLVEAVRAHLPDARIANATVRSDNLSKGRFDLPGLRAFTRAYARFVAAARSADVVYLVAAANSVGALRDAMLIATARALGKRVVLHLRGGSYGAFYADAPALLQAVLRRAWGAASLAIVQAPRLSTILAEAAPHVRVEVLPNGLPGNELERSTYPRRSVRLLFVGHLIASKGFDDLIAAFRVLRRARPDTVLVCAGELPLGTRVSEPGVEYAGIVTGTAKGKLFTSSDVFVLPSYSEGFSLAMLEAMFHGLPIVTTRVGAAPDVVGTHNGILVEPGDVAALAFALDRLTADPTLRRAMGERNASDARDRYELADVAARFVKLISAVDR